MPIYKFVCDNCGYEFEELVNTGTSNFKCSKCDKGRAKKIFSGSFSSNFEKQKMDREHEVYVTSAQPKLSKREI